MSRLVVNVMMCALTAGTAVAGCASRMAVNTDDLVRSYLAEYSSQEVLAVDRGSPAKIGQWAVYEVAIGGRVGYRRLRVLARDACGLWVEYREERPGLSQFVSFCFRRDQISPEELEAAIVYSDGVKHTLSFRNEVHSRTHQQLLALARVLFVPPAFPVVRVEDVTVAAGTFRQTRRLNSEPSNLRTVLWHSAAPFSGVIHAVSDDGLSMQLLAFGDTDTVSALIGEPESRVPHGPSEATILVGAGPGFVTETNVNGSSKTTNVFIGAGRKVRSNTGVFVGTNAIVALDSNAGSDYNATAIDLLLAIRHAPIRRHVSVMYAQTAVGVRISTLTSSEEWQRTVEIYDVGLVGDIRIGWLPIRGNSYGVGLELSVSFLLDGGAGLDRQGALLISSELDVL